MMITKTALKPTEIRKGPFHCEAFAWTDNISSRQIDKTSTEGAIDGSVLGIGVSDRLNVGTGMMVGLEEAWSEGFADGCCDGSIEDCCALDGVGRSEGDRLGLALGSPDS